MINIIWILFIILGITYGIFTGNISLVNTEIVNSAKQSLDIFLNIFPTIVLWLGIMTIAKDSGLLNKISNFLSPFPTASCILRFPNTQSRMETESL